MSPLRQRTSSGVIPSLDGIRGIAVLLVVFAHSGLQHFIPGGLGVTIFFVLSGYLITTLMRIEYGGSGTLNFRTFYLRRILRLMPPLFVVVLLAGVLSAAGLIGGGFSLTGLLSVLFYFGNYFVIAHHFTEIPAGLGVVWSLAVEEHYYFFYPPLALLLLRLDNRHVAAVALLILSSLVLAWRVWLARHGASTNYLDMATDTRMDAILVGCLMAQWCNPWLDPARVNAPLQEAMIIGACGVVLLFTLLYRDHIFRFTLRYTLQSFAIAPLIYCAVIHPTRWPFRWLNTRMMRHLGALSYTVYLSHQVILFGIQRYWPELGWSGTLAGTAILTLAFAEAMRRWVEAPFGILRRRFHPRASRPSAHSGKLRTAS